MPLTATRPMTSITCSTPENNERTRLLQQLYLKASYLGTDASLISLREPVYLDGIGTAILSNRLAIVVAHGYLVPTDTWCSAIGLDRVNAVLPGTAGNPLMMTRDMSIHDVGVPLCVAPISFLVPGFSTGDTGASHASAPNHLERRTPNSDRSAEIPRELIELLSMTSREISRMLGISDRGFRNWLAGARMRLPNEKRLLWLRHLAKLVESGVGKEGVREWFMTPVKGTTTPFDLIESGQLDEVARHAASQFERKSTVGELKPERARTLGFPYDVLEADDEDLRDLSRIVTDE